MNTFSLKVDYNGDVRRCSFNSSQLSFQSLTSKITSLYNFSTQNLLLKYEDDDGERITITTDLELNEARNFATGKNQILKIFVEVVGEEPKLASKPVNVNSNAPNSSNNSQFTSFAQKMGTNDLNEALLPQILSIMVQNDLRASQLTSSQIQNPNHPLFGMVGQLLKTMPKDQMSAILSSLLTAPVIQQMLPHMLLSLSTMGSSYSNPPLNVNQPNTETPSPTPAPVTSPTPTPQTTSTPEKEKVTHNPICDNCKQRIVGVIYKCGTCPDFDLCETCESSENVHNSDHVFFKVKKVTPIKITKIETPEPVQEPEPLQPEPIKKLLPPVAQFVRDITCADHTVVRPNSKFTKIWRFQNCGSAAWPSGIRIVWSGGDSMGATEADVPQVEPGKEVDISVELTAPSHVGHSSGLWRLATANGEKFGHTVWVDIIVEEKKEVLLPSSPKPQPTKPVDVAPVIQSGSPQVQKIIPVVSEVKPVEVAKPVEIAKPLEAPKLVEIPKPVEIAKPIEAPKSVENAKPIEAPKPVEIAKPLETPKVESPKPAEIPKPIEAPKPVSEPIKKEKTKFELALAQVEEMGFHEKDVNIQLLIKYNGDLLKVVQDLLTREEQKI